VAKKKERTKLTKTLDELCKQIIRIRDEYTCQYCGKRVSGCDAQTSHVVPKGNGASWRRFDLLNMKVLCIHDHFLWWHKNPTESGKWFAEKFPTRDKYLEKYRHGKPAKITTEEMKQLIIEYKQKLKELKEESDCGQKGGEK